MNFVKIIPVNNLLMTSTTYQPGHAVQRWTIKSITKVRVVLQLELDKHYYRPQRLASFWLAPRIKDNQRKKLTDNRKQMLSTKHKLSGDPLVLRIVDVRDKNDQQCQYNQFVKPWNFTEDLFMSTRKQTWRFKAQCHYSTVFLTTFLQLCVVAYTNGQYQGTSNGSDRLLRVKIRRCQQATFAYHYESDPYYTNALSWENRIESSHTI